MKFEEFSAFSRPWSELEAEEPPLKRARFDAPPEDLFQAPSDRPHHLLFQ